jgi:hypothetical protein
MAASSST